MIIYNVIYDSVQNKTLATISSNIKIQNMGACKYYKLMGYTIELWVPYVIIRRNILDGDYWMVSVDGMLVSANLILLLGIIWGNK
jgi:hypothetical protein